MIPITNNWLWRRNTVYLNTNETNNTNKTSSPSQTTGCEDETQFMWIPIKQTTQIRHHPLTNNWLRRRNTVYLNANKTNNTNKTWSPSQTTGCEDETQFILIPNIFIWSTTTFPAWKQCSVRFDLQLCVGRLMSYLRYLCLLKHSGVQHMVLCFCFVFLCLVYPMLPVSLDLSFIDCPFGILKRLFHKIIHNIENLSKKHSHIPFNRRNIV